MKPPEIINQKWLEENGFLITHRRSVHKVWKEGMVVTKENLNTLMTLRFSINTLAYKVLPPKVLKAFVLKRRYLKKKIQEDAIARWSAVRPLMEKTHKDFSDGKITAEVRMEQLLSINQQNGMSWNERYEMESSTLRKELLEFLWEYWDNWYEYEDHDLRTT